MKVFYLVTTNSEISRNMNRFRNISLVLLVLFTILFDSILAEKILVVSFFSSKSHKLTYMPIVEELGRRGHNVTVLSPIKTSKPMKNVTEHLLVDWEEVEKGFLEKGLFNPIDMKEKGESMSPFTMLNLFGDLCRDSYDKPIIQQVLKEKYDLVFFRPVFNDCVLGLIYRLKAPYVLYAPVNFGGFLEKMGGHIPPAVNPNLFLGYPDEMTFYQRFKNFGANLFFENILRFYYEPAMTQLYREKLGHDIPAVAEILGNASLILSPTHFSLFGSKPLFQDVIEVGGAHTFVPSKPLPKEVEEFIQKGKNGFIFFSMGSAIKGSTMSEAKRKIFLNVFSKLKQQVLWKWETESMPDLPPNVKLSKWLPQQDLLAHKDIKMFITHCGGGSTEESIYNGVPLIGFPMFGDQLVNAKMADKHGFIVELDWNTVTEEALMHAVTEILNNAKYHESAKKISKFYRDRPDDPLQKAVYWIEYVLRHKGAAHMRSVGRNLYWFQYHSYDIILTYLGLITSAIYLIVTSSKWVIRKTCCRSPSSIRKGGKSKKE